MILDTQSRFSDAQAVTVTAISTNVIDLRNAATPALVDEGIQDHNWLVVSVGTAFTAGGAGTLTVSLESDSTADLATSPTVHYVSPVIAVASLVVGYELRLKLPSGNYERYLGVRFTVATGPMLTGAINAFITPVPQRNVIYPKSFTVA